jgi:GT2 family glycosyltransferase
VSTPPVSVIVPAYHSERRIGACLAALARQRDVAAEVIVVNSSEEQPTRSRVADAHPGARFTQSATRLLPHDARNVGAERASGQLLVFTDPDCVAADDWLARLVARADGGERAVAGAVVPDSDAAGVPVGAFACKFRAVLPGGPAARPFGQTANLLVERAAFDRIGGFRPGLYSADVALCVDLRRSGVRVVFEPDAVVRHCYDVDVGSFLRERLARGADFGRVRPELEGWSTTRTAAHVLATPLAGARASAATLRAAGSAGLRLGTGGVAAVVAGQLAWVAGEAVGYGGAIRSAPATV